MGTPVDAEPLTSAGRRLRAIVSERCNSPGNPGEPPKPHVGGNWDNLAALGLTADWAKRYLAGLAGPWPGIVLRAVVRTGNAGIAAGELDRFLAHGFRADELVTAENRTSGSLKCNLAVVARRLLVLLDAGGAAATSLADKGRVDLLVLLLNDLIIAQNLRVPDGAMPGWRAAFGLTDRFAQQVPPGLALRSLVSAGPLQEWVGAVGADGSAWAAAGYSLDEAKALVSLPVGHPARPGVNQLAAMAGLRGTAVVLRGPDGAGGA